MSEVVALKVRLAYNKWEVAGINNGVRFIRDVCDTAWLDLVINGANYECNKTQDERVNRAVQKGPSSPDNDPQQ